MEDTRVTAGSFVKRQLLGLPQGWVATAGMLACAVVGALCLASPEIVGFAHPALGQALLFFGWTALVFIFYVAVGHAEHWFSPKLCALMLGFSAAPFWLAYN